MGVYIGETFTAASASNPKGHWEHSKIFEIHSKLLRDLLVGSDQPNMSLPDSWWSSEALADTTDEIRKLVRSEFNVDLWAWKDPRTCLTVPLWHSVLSNEEIPIDYVILVRNPLDSARSLEKRDGIPLHKGLALWLLYTLSALHYSRGARRIVLHYNSYLADWRSSLNGVAKALDIPVHASEQELEQFMGEFLTETLRHHNSTVENLLEETGSSLLADVYQMCLDAEKDPTILASDQFCNKIEQHFLNFKFMTTNSFSESLNWSVKLYCAGKGNFSEENSSVQSKPTTGEFVDCSFQLPVNHARFFTLVFATAPTVIDVMELKIQIQDGKVLHAWSHRNNFSGIAVGQGFLRWDDGVPWLRLVTIGPDVTLRFGFQQSAATSLGVSLTVKIVLRVHKENSPWVTRVFKESARHLATQVHR